MTTLAFTEAEMEELQKIALADGVPVSVLVENLIREAQAERLRTSPRVGGAAKIHELLGASKKPNKDK